MCCVKTLGLQSHCLLSWSEFYCGNVDLSWVGSIFFLGEYGQRSVMISITAASTVKGSRYWMDCDFNCSVWNGGKLMIILPQLESIS